MIFSKNNVLAVEPVKEVAPQVKVAHGLACQEQRVSLIPVKVVFDGSGDLKDIQAGDTVYVDGTSLYRSDWARKIYQIEGKSVILMPSSLIFLVAKANAKNQ